MNYSYLTHSEFLDRNLTDFPSINTIYDVRILALLDCLVYLAETTAITEKTSADVLVLQALFQSFLEATETENRCKVNKIFAKYPELHKVLNYKGRAKLGDR